MENKLTINELAPYLPYGLKVSNGKEIITVTIYTLADALLNSDEFKPLLRPLSDLTSDIEHNGKRFVPMIELFKIENGCFDEGEFIAGEIARVSDCGIREGDSPCYFIEYFTGFEMMESLSFKNNDFTKVWIQDKYKIGGIIGIQIHNQQMIFQKLYEWHFDMFGLVEKGLALKINK